MPAFMWSAGTVKVALSRSISSQVASLASRLRRPVKARNSRQDFSAHQASESLIVARASPSRG